jgi:RNA polymerase sigma-70 factor (ECF subfamily)
VEGWLYRILTNLLRDYLRNPRRRQDPSGEGTGEPSEAGVSPAPVASAAPGPLERLLQKEEQRRLYECMQRLPPEQEIALRLYYLEELTYERIGQECGCALGTARNRVLRALAAVRECMNRQQGEENG